MSQTMQAMVYHGANDIRFEKAYEVFKHASDEKALKVIIDYS